MAAGAGCRSPSRPPIWWRRWRRWSARCRPNDRNGTGERERMKALVVDKPEAGQPARAAFRDFAESELPEGDVLLRVTHSTVNYKDGLAVTGKAPVVRRFPMVPGIDFAGVVESSTSPGWKPGDGVILNGWGVGETHLGGHAEKARVKGEWLVPLP